MHLCSIVVDTQSLSTSVEEVYVSSLDECDTYKCKYSQFKCVISCEYADSNSNTTSQKA